MNDSGIRKNDLAEAEARRVWEKMFEAEVRSYYFGDLASAYTRRKQIITGLSFFLSSGAAASLIAKGPTWIAIAIATIVAILAAYSMAVGLDKRANAMAKLHYEWNHLAADYEQLWNHWYEENARETLEDLDRRARDVSEAGTELPYKPKLIDKWTKFVEARFAEPEQTPALTESYVR